MQDNHATRTPGQYGRIVAGIAMFAALGFATSHAGEIYSQTSHQRTSTGFSTTNGSLSVSVENAGAMPSGAVRIQNSSTSDITVTSWALSQPLVVAANSDASGECSTAWGQTHVAAGQDKNSGSVYVDVQCGDTVHVKTVKTGFKGEN